MKIKLGSALLNHRALRKLILLFFLTGILIGVMIAMLEKGRHVTLLPFVPIYIVVLPVLVRGIRKEIASGRAA